MTIDMLRHRIVIEEVALTGDGLGGQTELYSTHATVWAKIEPVSANQISFSQSLEHRVTHKITVREYSGLVLKSDMRITFESRIFHIRSFRNMLERDKFIEIMAEEGAPS